MFALLQNIFGDTFTEWIIVSWVFLREIFLKLVKVTRVH